MSTILIWANVLRNLNRFLEQRMFIIIFSGILLGLLLPGLASWESLVAPLFGYLTFVTSLNTSWRALVQIARMPGPAILIIILLHIVMPLFALGLSSVSLGLSSPFTVGLVLAAIIPIGVTSVIWTGLARGETPLALTTVSLDSLLSPLIVPVSVLFLLGRSVQFNSTSLMAGLVWMIVLPTILGVTLYDLTRGEIGPRLSYINGPLSKLCLTLVVAINVAAASAIITGTPQSVLSLLPLILLQVIFGYLLGYFVGKIFRFSPDRLATMTFCVGIRNISAGIVIALQYFSPEATVPVVLGMLFQQPLASLFHRWLTRATSTAD